jgi:cephalosporin-C deacetylase-like acetyl esterase
MEKQPNAKIKERIEKATVKVKLGQKVLVTNADGTQYLAEIAEFHEQIKGWITKVKIEGKDGYTFKEVSELVVDAVMIVKDITLSDVGKAIAQFFKNLFSKK